MHENDEQTIFNGRALSCCKVSDKKTRSKRINNLNVFCSRLNRFFLEYKFQISFSNMSVRNFFKKISRK